LLHLIDFRQDHWQKTCPPHLGYCDGKSQNYSEFFAVLRKHRELFSFVKINPQVPIPQAAKLKGKPLPELGTDSAPLTIAATKWRYPWMKVVDLMTIDPLTVTAAETVGKANELMAENNIRQIPVVNGRELLGIVTDRDIRAFLSEALVGEPEARERALGTAVGDIMTTEPLSIAPDDDLKDAVEMLIEQKFGAIPVVDEAEGVVGIVSYVDVLRNYLERLQEESI
jgi:CBS domain-containing protein